MVFALCSGACGSGSTHISNDASTNPPGNEGRQDSGVQPDASMPPGDGRSLRFYGGNFENQQVDRVLIALDNPERPVDIGAGDFTLEFWMRAPAGAGGGCVSGGVAWINGMIIIDRDINGTADYGDFGVSLFSDGRIAYGVAVGSNENTVCGATNVANNQWHHIAATRNATTGQLRLFVDGQQDASGSGPTGNASYRNGRSTSNPSSDPYLVLGGEKHAFAGYPWYAGWLDELRLSTSVRYTSNFTRPSAPFNTDAQTAALYHFDEGQGVTLGDTSGAAGGPSNGMLYVGGLSNGPTWSSETPF